MRIILLTLCLVFSLSATGQKVNKDFIDGEIYLKVKNKPFGSLSSVVNLSNELNFLQKVSSEFLLQKTSKPFFTNNSDGLQKIYRLKLKSSEKTDEIIGILKQMPEVERVERVPMRRVIATPNDPNTGSQWFLNKIKAFESWNVNPGGKSIVVAVVDNAIQVNHIDLQANMLAGIDIADNDANPNPPNELFNHGTHVAGIVSAVTNNGTGIASAANNRVKILPVKASSDADDHRTLSMGFEGVLWAIEHGAEIISLSWGGIEFSESEQEVIDYAFSKGIIVVAAAGNENSQIMNYPAGYRHVIAVASLDNNDQRSSFSNYGKWIDISAPGRGIFSTVPFNTYVNLNGTSMSTPLVASALGYIWSCFPLLTATQIENLLLRTADNLDSANPTTLGLLGFGRVNLLKAVSCGSAGLIDTGISAGGDPYLCQGQTITLTAKAGLGYTYKWFKNGILAATTTTASYNANTDGYYSVMINAGECSIISEEIKISQKTVSTSAPTVTDKEVIYCSTDNTLKATIANCNYGGPTTFTYNGPMVGYDGFNKSGDDPTVTVFTLSGNLTNIKVSITWQKKNQSGYNSCDLPDLGGTPFNDEVSFKLKSPSGKIISLIKTSTYRGGDQTSGIVTTIFETGANQIPSKSVPLSGTFAPAEAFTPFLNESPSGIWTLLPEDNNAIDPLCVTGFSLTLTSNGIAQAPSITWWSAVNGGSLLATGSTFNTSANEAGEKTFYVQAQCEGLCPSPRVPVKFTVLTVPQVFVFPISENTANDVNFKELIKKPTLSFIKNNQSVYQIYDAADPQATSFALGDTPPMTSPITMCTNTSSYLLLAQGCPTNVITWNNGANGQSLIVTPSSPIGYNAYCHKEWWPCTPISSNNILFVSPSDVVSIKRKIYANSVQTFTGNSIIAENFIETPAKTLYRANTSISLNPGFNVSANSVFTARIGNCSN